jgi:hypothetical protein
MVGEEGDDSDYDVRGSMPRREDVPMAPRGQEWDYDSPMAPAAADVAHGEQTSLL